MSLKLEQKEFLTNLRQLSNKELLKELKTLEKIYWTSVWRYKLKLIPWKIKEVEREILKRMEK